MKLVSNGGMQAGGGIMTEKKPVLWTRDFLLVCIYNLLILLCFQMIMAVLPVYVKSLGGSTVIIGVVNGIFTVSSLVVRPLSGKWLDKYGREGLWIVGSAGLLAGAAGHNWALSIPLLIMLRIFHGAAFSIVTNASSAVATDLTPKVRLGEGMGFFGLGTNIGMAVGPATAFYLIDRLNFSAVFWCATVLATMALLTIKLIRLPKRQRQIDAPPPALWEPSAVRPAALMFIPAFILSGVNTFVPIYGMEMGVINAGLYFTVYALSLIIVRPLSGLVFDRMGHRWIIISGFLFLSAGMTILSLSRGLLLYLLAAVINGIGFGAIHPALQALAVANCPPSRRAIAQATFLTSFDVGVGAGAVLLGCLAQFTGYAGMYLASAFISMAGLMVYFVFGVNKVERPDQD